MEKEKARKSWRTNCEHLAEQDAIITAQEGEMAALKHGIVELEAEVAKERDRSKAPSPRTRSPRPSGHHCSSEAVESTLPAACVEDSLPHPHPVPPGTGMSPKCNPCSHKR